MAALTLKQKKGKGKRGNIAGLSKHLANTLGGDPHFHTKCTGSDELAGYNTEQKNAICAKAHKLVTGHWPGEHGGKNKTGREKKEYYDQPIEDWLNMIRKAVQDKLNAGLDNQVNPSKPYSYVENTYMDGKVIVNRDNKFYVVGFDVDDDGEIVVGDEMVEVERGPWIPVVKECCGKRATIRLKGGAGSGNFGHGGRPGKIGGSSSSGGGGGGDDGTKGDRKHGKKSATHWANTMRDYSSRIDEAAKSKKLAKVFSDGLASESKIALKAERHVTSKRIAEAKLFFDNGEIRDAKKVLDAIASEMENKSK